MKYLLALSHRLIWSVFVLIGVSIITFSLSFVLPADPAKMMAGEFASKETIIQIRESLKLDEPLIKQYLNYAQGVVQGDLGTSIRSGKPVLEEIMMFLPATIELSILVLTLAISIGIPTGVMAALYQNKLLDQFSRLVSVSFMSIPSFWLGLMAIYLFYGALGWLPSGGRMSLDYIELESITGLRLVDSLLLGNLGAFVDALKHIIMPAFVLALMSAGSIARLVRSSMIEVLSQDYVRTATASGLPRTKVIWICALPNALIPVVTALGMYLAALLSGVVVTELIFSWPGVGSYMMTSISAMDFPAIMGFTLITSVIYVFANLISDLLVMYFNPRVAQVG